MRVLSSEEGVNAVNACEDLQPMKRLKAYRLWLLKKIKADNLSTGKSFSMDCLEHVKKGLFQSVSLKELLMKLKVSFTTPLNAR
jgi:hypothetical protein